MIITWEEWLKRLTFKGRTKWRKCFFNTLWLSFAFGLISCQGTGIKQVESSFDGLQSCKFFPLKSSYDSGYYITQDEYEIQAYSSNLSGTGMGMAVGSLRALQLLAFSNADYGILLDYDKAVVRFNQAIVSVIAGLSEDKKLTTAMQRLHFLSLLGGYEDFNELSLVAQIPNGKKQAVALLKKLVKTSIGTANWYQRKWETFSPDLKVPSSIKTQYQKLSKIVLALKGEAKERTKNYIVSIASHYGQNFEQQGDKADFFWESDLQWEKVASLLKHKKMLVIHGSYKDHQFLESLKNCVLSLKTSMSFIDVSSIFESKMFINDSQRDKLIDFIFDVPKNSQSRLIFTSHNDQKTQKELQLLKTGGEPKFWRYYSFGLKNKILLEDFFSEYTRYKP